jgi:hypothetical protein
MNKSVPSGEAETGDAGLYGIQTRANSSRIARGQGVGVSPLLGYVVGAESSLMRVFVVVDSAGSAHLSASSA